MTKHNSDQSKRGSVISVINLRLIFVGVLAVNEVFLSLTMRTPTKYQFTITDPSQLSHSYQATTAELKKHL